MNESDRSPPRPAGRFELVVLNGSDAGRVIPLPECGSVTLGRAPENGIHVSEPTVSAIHVRFLVEGGRCLIEDLGSRNGTLVGDRKVDRARLVHGFGLALGQLQLVFRDALAGSEPLGPDAPTIVHAGLLGSRREEGAFLPREDEVRGGRSDHELLNLLAAVGQVARAPNATEDRIVREVLDHLRGFLDADRVAFQPEEDASKGHYVTHTELGPRIPRIPRSVLRQVRGGETVSLFFGGGEEAGARGSTVVDQGIQTLLCAPCVASGEFLGYLYADRVTGHGSFDDRRTEALSAVADVLASHLVCLRAAKRAIEFERRLKERENQALSGILISGAAHDLANLLASLASRAQAAAEDASRLESLPQAVHRLSRKGARKVRAILAQGGRAAEEWILFDAREVASEANLLLEGRCRIARVRLDLLAPGRSCLVEGRRGEILDAILQLAMNGMAAMPGGGILGIRIRPEHGEISLAVRDTGVGMPTERIRRILDRPGELGFGLELVRRIVEGHRGRFLLRSRIGVGTDARILLPRATAGRGSIASRVDR